MNKKRKYASEGSEMVKITTLVLSLNYFPNGQTSIYKEIKILGGMK